MKGQEIIDMIKKNNLEDFDFLIRTTEYTESFPDVKIYDIVGIEDIGHMNKNVSLEIREI